MVGRRLIRDFSPRGARAGSVVPSGAAVECLHIWGLSQVKDRQKRAGRGARTGPAGSQRCLVGRSQLQHRCAQPSCELCGAWGRMGAALLELRSGRFDDTLHGRRQLRQRQIVQRRNGGHVEGWILRHRHGSGEGVAVPLLDGDEIHRNLGWVDAAQFGVRGGVRRARSVNAGPERTGSTRTLHRSQLHRRQTSDPRRSPLASPRSTASPPTAWHRSRLT